MNKKLAVTLGLIAALSVATVSAMAESTIYTDGIGRIHFLGRDAANNVKNSSNYSNTAEQDLTRKLYEERGENGVINDTSFDQHPLKNYENTFPDSRFNTTKYWNTKYNNNIEDATVKTGDKMKGSMTFEKGASERTYVGNYGNTTLISVPEADASKSEITTTTTKKKHWWQKKK